MAAKSTEVLLYYVDDLCKYTILSPEIVTLHRLGDSWKIDKVSLSCIVFIFDMIVCVYVCVCVCVYVCPDFWVSVIRQYLCLYVNRNIQKYWWKFS